ncbi:hypothetical protein LXA43DRAFT_908454, partial [Ganoderma leucocontextum]
VYEYCITLDKEIEFFWGRRPNGGSLLFFTSRYLPLLARAVDISGYTVKNEPIFNVCRYAAFAGVRAWVLGGRNWALTAFVVVLSLIPIGIEYVSTPSNKL